MTDGTRILRTVAVPVVVAIVFLFLVPKTCQKAVGTKKLRPLNAAAPTDTALHIQSESPDAPPSRPAPYPAGLDAQRVQYLIEIDQRFVDPLMLRLPKPGGLTLLSDDSADALVRAGWFEQSGGGYTPTHEAALHIPDITEESLAWRVPVGKRKFGHVLSVEKLEEGRVRVGFSWQWEPNEAGRTIKPAFEVHQGSADFGGGGEHSWDLTALNVDSDWR